ncbi:MAG TPA: type II secretion system protein [Thermoanaerobaculia bacterium]|nr:type II secretion system protein [Thermoanaerobaculia bacterium]
MRRHKDFPLSAAPGQAGFSLIEMLVTLAVFAVLLVAILEIFQINSNVGRVQMNVADMQQALRITQQEILRMSRMAGRGGLPVADAAQNLYPPQGIALAVQNNVADGTRMAAGEDETLVLPGTDVLTLRGVFETPLYQINYADSTTFALVPPAAAGGTVTGKVMIRSVSTRGVAQPLDPLIELIEAEVPQAILLTSPMDDAVYAVVQLDPGSCDYDEATRTWVQLAFRTDGEYGDEYLRLSYRGAFDPALQSVGHLGILEEHRFYVRRTRAIPGDETSAEVPRFTRGRFFPGTDVAYLDDDNARQDIADFIVDLQFALGLDTVNAGGRNGDILETTDGNSDDWLLNRTGEAGDNAWRAVPPETRQPPVYYLRINALARADRADLNYMAPLLTRIEDHTFNAASPINRFEERRYRRRLLQTVVDLRNLA